MKGVPQSTDELMWLIAEAEEPGAVDAFIRRYPEHRSELIKRLNMVRDLKGARPPQARILSKPRFEGRDPIRLTTHLGLRTALMALPLVGVLWASYWFTANYVRRSEQRTEVAKSEQQQTVPGSSDRGALSPRTHREPPQSSTTDSVEIPPPTPYDRPLTLNIEKTTLLEALAAISRMSGLSIELAPDVANPTISLDYSGVAALTVLKDMGQTLGFSAFDQGDRKVLIIPAVDPKTQEAPPLVPEGGTQPVDDESEQLKATGRRMTPSQSNSNDSE